MEPTASSDTALMKARVRARGPGTSRRFAYLVVGLLALGLVGWLVGRPAYRKVKAQRAATLIQEASQLADQGKWAEAVQAMRTASGLAPSDPEVLRVSSRLSARNGSPNGLLSLQALLRMKAATFQDHLDFIRMALDFNRVDLSGPEIASLLKTHRNNPELLKLAIRHLQLMGNPENAIITAREWLSREPANPEAEFTLGLLLSGAGNPLERLEGQRLLLGLAVGKTSQRNDAVDALATMPDLPRAETQLLLKALSERTNSQLAIANLKIRLDPEERPRIVEEIVESTRGTTNTTEIVRYVSWLRDNGEVKQIPDLLPEDLALGKPELMTARLEALILSDRVNEVLPYLQMNEAPVEPYLQHCLNALAASKQGKGTLVRTYFDSALAAAGNSIPKIVTIATYAEKMDQPLAAVAAYQRLMQYPPFTVYAGRQIMRLVGPLDDIYTIRDTLKKLSAFMPQDDSLYLASAYAGFLLGEAPPEVRDALAKRAKKAPDEKLYPLVMALGQLKAGNAAEALNLIESVKVDWDNNPEPRWLALYAAILGENDQREAARVMAAKVDQSQLKGAERELIKQWLPR